MWDEASFRRFASLLIGSCGCRAPLLGLSTLQLYTCVRRIVPALARDAVCPSHVNGMLLDDQVIWPETSPVPAEQLKARRVVPGEYGHSVKLLLHCLSTVGSRYRRTAMTILAFRVAGELGIPAALRPENGRRHTVPEVVPVVGVSKRMLLSLQILTNRNLVLLTLRRLSYKSPGLPQSPAARVPSQFDCPRAFGHGSGRGRVATAPTGHGGAAAAGLGKAGRRPGQEQGCGEEEGEEEAPREEGEPGEMGDGAVVVVVGGLKTQRLSLQDQRIKDSAYRDDVVQLDNGYKLTPVGGKAAAMYPPLPLHLRRRGGEAASFLLFLRDM
ncbi:hypothetical protein JMJ35_008201 [Cladonia borealis]|uniref:Uncharacterized protein n=1 Tax=Cladonia borealis TaxID=184061 RepID=A0AA39QV46_9LECA|nr:hypothetical protein JMJ35_008201 [Cladonia borealis]